MMFKIPLLQSWYNLSNPDCEKQLARDLLQMLLNHINLQLNAKGLLVKTGEASIIDASVIQAKNNRSNKNAKGENTQNKGACYKCQNGLEWKTLKMNFGGLLDRSCKGLFVL